MIVSDARRALPATDRWAWLPDVLDRWYAAPLTAADGSPPDEVAAAAHRVGKPLPEPLVEWFTLVGRRPAAVQDAPATPATLPDRPARQARPRRARRQRAGRRRRRHDRLPGAARAREPVLGRAAPG
ncbi:hypothetical protein ABZ816_15475 [Actinosynnema sp. NPDC047251]|uniref:hypothetical protein n=1 Tax=Saccharothrix espanaensis TaxID=103731 RepID=UPI00031928F2|nr:hypothetical protein [Saccharothrix espanaensis]